MFVILCLFVPIHSKILSTSSTIKTDNCTTLKNSTKKFLDMNVYDKEQLEKCVFKFLIDSEMKFNDDPNSFHTNPPPEAEITIQVDDVTIHHVQLNPGSSYQFQIYGDIYLTWEDSRLRWDEDEWKMESFFIQDTHKIWSPSLIDHSICTDISVCSSELTNVEILSEGRVYARLVFRYSAYCVVDYSRYELYVERV
ncbi:hypothetical protein DICVIV_06165 [Dictyocaulus viviparus]|uniref:Neurotransmitter-gated ion-channel ligand-binding domain-containing protein n=1 Tax=Dictyocaulus viviparus TaxID=29172 RepID=A0A0D8XZK1_DICVI|nr:hypothetical protein DICVIV_06165 [Dictyocaulus viviparus]